MIKHVFGVASIGVVMGGFLLGSETPSLTGRWITQADAIIGRPLTPLSYAGVARRTARRSVYAGAAYGAYAAHPPVYGAPVYGAPPPAYYPPPSCVYNAYGQMVCP